MATAINRRDLDAGRIDLSDIITGKRIPPTAPGNILRDILSELNITPYRLARSARVPQNRIAGILAGTRAITADTSIRLGRVLGQSDRYWLNLQGAYDVARAESGDGGYDEIEPLTTRG